ncbi:hypothetical protein FRACA_2450006 [Frankia canadensis]|uniref:Uncharacterized protein n=1 Tax=Frankia canadensis TaxID=1836972 RepID=A0A2I2KRW1_9ACTN|nr:hypothetical protein FRACA_2450006 [Frankia canadensis]SOU55682.1 hypothetical protein FRACA_2450006 [Frankia canadensis]
MSDRAPTWSGRSRSATQAPRLVLQRGPSTQIAHTAPATGRPSRPLINTTLHNEPTMSPYVIFDSGFSIFGIEKPQVKDLSLAPQKKGGAPFTRLQVECATNCATPAGILTIPDQMLLAVDAPRLPCGGGACGEWRPAEWCTKSNDLATRRSGGP